MNFSNFHLTTLYAARALSHNNEIRISEFYATYKSLQ